MKTKQFDWGEFIDHSRVCVYCSTKDRSELFIKEMSDTSMSKQWYWHGNLKPMIGCYTGAGKCINAEEAKEEGYTILFYDQYFERPTTEDPECFTEVSPGYHHDVKLDVGDHLIIEDFGNLVGVYKDLEITTDMQLKVGSKRSAAHTKKLREVYKVEEIKQDGKIYVGCAGERFALDLKYKVIKLEEPKHMYHSSTNLYCFGRLFDVRIKKTLYDVDTQTYSYTITFRYKCAIINQDELARLEIQNVPADTPTGDIKDFELMAEAWRDFYVDEYIHQRELRQVVPVSFVTKYELEICYDNNKAVTPKNLCARLPKQPLYKLQEVLLIPEKIVIDSIVVSAKGNFAYSCLGVDNLLITLQEQEITKALKLREKLKPDAEKKCLVVLTSFKHFGFETDGVHYLKGFPKTFTEDFYVIDNSLDNSFVLYNMPSTFKFIYVQTSNELVLENSIILDSNKAIDFYALLKKLLSKDDTNYARLFYNSI